YDRIHTREIARYGGLVHRMPRYAVIFMIFTMATIGLPGTSGFVGEFLILVGVYQVSTWTAFFATTGVILGAAYSLWLYRRVVFGELVKEDLKNILDVNKREMLIFAPLIIVAMWIGIYPEPFLNIMHASVTNLMEQHQLALEAAQSSIQAAK
ncbi:MAG: proton-conducting transporter membrane subunit, partial [Sneathiella sp.]